ncbi:SIMPL domain-containing protein [Cohnella fermenti]|uniref:DUF541 domain-containing protein n=1 Tax=Cohnella fermenti TaxID=2565925 RepID=A0A4S4BGL6_9BACL|nr:SIMPL domain-containing protein [Cohnella fermenti]THF73575.1 DUF541 domain-containing protein [Cohnella fermenti]
MIGKGWKVTALALAVVLASWIGFGGQGEVKPVSAETTTSAASAASTITVGAEGSIKVEPDIAYVKFSVETRGANAKAAQQANADAFAAVEKVLYTTYGLAKQDVQTTGFDVQPEYNYTEKEGQVLKGYVANHSVQVSYRKLTEIGKLLDDLSAAGANRMNGVRFSTEKQDQYELEALKQAMTNADAKAAVLATSAKKQLGEVLNIVQGDVSPIPVIQTESLQMAKAMSDAASTSIQSGQIEISASVTVQYAMK